MWNIDNPPKNIQELEEKIYQHESDFLIGLHLDTCIPEDADMEEITDKFLKELKSLPKEPGAHYRVDLQEFGLEGFANVYYVAPGMGGIFSYSGPIMVGRT